METINVTLDGKIVAMVVTGTNNMDTLPKSKSEMITNGWEPVIYYAKRPKGARHHIVYKRVRCGTYQSIVSVR